MNFFGGFRLMTGESQAIIIDFRRCKVFAHMLLSQKQIKNPHVVQISERACMAHALPHCSIQTLLIIFMGFNYFRNSHYSS